MIEGFDLFEPSPYFAWVVHLDGMRKKSGTTSSSSGGHLRQGRRRGFGEARRRGFRVNTNTTFLTTDTLKTVRDVLDFLNDELRRSTR